MRPHPSQRAPRTLAPRRPRRLLLGALAALALLGSGGGAALALRPGVPPAEAPPALPDTVAVYGPRRFGTPTGGGAYHVERFAVAVEPGARYTLRARNGAADGSARLDSARVVLNGATVLSAAEVAAASGVVARPVEAGASNVLEVHAHGPAGAWMELALVQAPDPAFTVFGPRLYQRAGGDPATVVERFTLAPTAAAPHRLHLVNGPGGAERVSSARVVVNGVEVVSPGDLGNGVATLERAVSLRAENVVEVTLQSTPGARLSLRFTATDVTPPRLRIDAPPAGLVTRDSAVAARGQVLDETAAEVEVDGVPAAMAGGAFSLAVPLPDDGAHTLVFTARDAAGHRTDSTRTVTRDTRPPDVVLAAPADGLVTRQGTVEVRGVVHDLTAVTINVNGTPATVDANGAFSATVTLTEGVNFVAVAAADQAGNATTLARQVTLDTQPPIVTILAPDEGTTTAAERVRVEGVAQDATPVTVTVAGTPAPVGAGGAFAAEAALAEGPNTIAVVATDAAGNTASAARSVTRRSADEALPPDPATVAPPLDPTRANPLSTSASFLYTGDRPIQAGVAPGALDPVRVSVLRGRAIGLDGAPLSGVHVTVQGHPELGSTRTRADGWYDLAVNAGARVVLQYAKDGFLPAQRNAEPVGQGFAPVDDVALVRLDPRVSAVDFAQPVDVARGSVVSDADGSRQATLFFEGGTTAEMVMPDGSTRPLPSVHVRVTELSVGEHGRAAVPGTLPGAAEYAYGVDLRVEEAAAAGAAQVRFSRPVTLYVENFVGFPDGTAVPTGHYDPATASWVPTDDGRVVRILSVDGGAASLDLDGDGAAEGDSALAALGITLAERQELASTYAAGQSLWRVRVSHFSNWWCGWPYNLPPDARYPDGDYEPEKEKDCVDLESGSVIECQNQALGQRVAVAGTRYTLNYRSTRAPGRTAGRTLQITLSRDQVPENLRRIDLHVFVAGQAHRMSFDPAPNRTHTFTWDGKDAYGRDVQGGAAVDVRVGWVFDYTYTTPAPKLKRTFGAASGQRLPCEYVCGYNREPPQRTLWQAFTDTLRVWNAGAHGKLGGWTLEPHHAYDPVGRTLYRGDGERRSAATQHLQMGTVAGTGKWECGYWNARYDCIGDGGPAKEAQLYEPTGVAFGPDGSQYIVEWRGNRVRRVAPDGTITTVAGTGDWCDYGDLDRDCGDGGPATQAKLSFPSKVAVAPDGTLYIADTYNTAIRRVAPDGTITTVAGNNTFCSTARTWPCGDGVPGTEAHLDYVRDVALHPDGSLYIADAGNGLIRRLTPDGIVTIVAGDGTADGCWEMTGPRPAREVCLSYPEGLAFGEDGSVYIAEGWMDRVLRLAPDGILHVVAGGTDGCYPHDAPCGDGGPATQAQMAWPQALAFGRDGALYVSDAGNDRVRRFEVGGTIRTVAGTGSSVGCTRSTDLCGDGGHAAAAQLGWPDQLAFGPDGGLYIADTFNGKVRRISPPLPGFTDADAAVVSDDGAELYHFDDRGRHLRTLDPQTGIELFRFAYDAAGLLAGVTDADGKTTTVERGPDGTALAVVAPGGERTALAMDGAGWLAEVASPAGRVRAEYTPGGLMTALVDPRGNRRGYAFDGAGRLERADDPAGGSLTLARAADASGDGVTVTTAGAKTRGYRVEALPGGGERRVTTTAAGLATTVTYTPRGVWTTRWADGTTRTLTEGADPRFGSQSPTLKGLTLATPGGRTLSLSGARRATLADPADPLSLTAQLDSVTVNGRSYTTAFDAVGRVLTHTTPTGRQSATRLDAAGRIVEARPAGLEPVRYEYDAGGRLAATVHGGRRRTLEYDAAGRIERVTDPLGRSETYVYDAAGRLAVQRLPDGREIAYGYDAGGNLASVTPPSRPAHALAYTPLDREGAYTAPAVGADSAALRYVYNADRQVDRVVRPDGVEIVFGYDGGGRLQTVETPVGTTSLSYDAATGKVASITAPGGGTLAYAYDGWLPLQTTWSGEVSGSVAMRYNADLWVVAQKVNGDSVPFAYDRDGLLTRAGALTVARAAASGLVTGTTLGSVTTRRGYTPLGELSGDTVRFGATLLYASAYTRDALGRVAGAVETVGGATAAYVFDYDSAGRLRTVTRDGVAVEAYRYDDNGNRTYAAGPGGAASAEYDAQDRLGTYGDAAYAFGAGGELRTRAVGADTTRYTYDALGNLRAAELAGGTRIDYLVDGQNRRIGKKVDGVLVQGFLYQDQLRPVAELDGAGQVRTRFVYGTRAGVPDYMVRDGRTYRIVADPRGSVRMVVDAATGAVAQRIDYDAYGRVLLDTNPGFQPFGFGGGLYDRHTGLVRLGARDYEAGTGRWTARDPRGFASGNANLYAYVGGDPVNYVDPDGQIAFLAFVWALVEGGLTAMDIWDVLKEMLSACPDKGKALAAAGSLLAGAFLPGGNYDDIPVIGRWFDTAVAEAWPGHRTLNIPQQQWTPEINRGWIQDIIDRGQDVYLASPQTIENIWDNARDALRPFGEELMQLLDAGYRQVGDWMRAPGNAPRPRPSGRPSAAGAAAAGVAGAAAICKCP